MQGPAERLPVSSSAHVALVPHLLGWDARGGPLPGGGYAALPPHLRKTFEVALHAGSAPALLLALRGHRFRDPHLAVGIAQALALVPGVSRYGAALTASRARGITRDAAASLALRAAVPVTVGAGVLKGARILRQGVPRELRDPLAAGAGAALVTGLAAVPLARSTRWRGLAAYRIALGAAGLWRGR